MPTPAAEQIIAAHDAYDRAVANLRNAVALPADDPRDAERLRGNAAAAYAKALTGLDEIDAAVRATGPVRAPGAEEPFGEAKPAPAAKAA